MNIKSKTSGHEKDYVRRQLQDLISQYGMNTVYHALSYITGTVASSQEPSGMIGGPKGNAKQAKSWRKIASCLADAAEQIDDGELTEGPNT